MNWQPFRLVVCLLLLTLAPLADELKIVEGGQWNVFLDGPAAQTHLLHRPEGRTIFAFPAENSGVALWYDGEMTYTEGSLTHLPDPAGQTVSATFEVKSPLRVKTVILDNIRVIRDHNNGVDTVRHVTEGREAFAREHHLGAAWFDTAAAGGENEVVFSRLQPSYGPYTLTLKGDNVTRRGDAVTVSPGALTVIARCPFPELGKLPLSQLLHPDYLEELPGLSPREKAAIEALEFLTTEEKMMAGSWRFLTYFGRDTLISLSMLEPILSDRGLENGVRSVLTRLSPEGAVAHEEDIGSWAEWRHLQQQPPRYSLKPVYDYKMIDDDLLLPVLLRKLRQNDRKGVWDELLADAASRRAIALNADYVLRKLSSRQPLLLNPGELVGEWRDSEQGLGGGVDPYSVNGALTVPALHALVDTFDSLEQPEKARQARQLIPVYEEIEERFWVTLPAGTVKERLERFRAGLDKDQRVAFDRLDTAVAGPLTIPLLSFSKSGEANVVSHTDVAFNLFYQTLTEAQLDRILTFLEQPFPLGVMTEVGPVVANPALSTEAKHHKELGLGQYHGIVVWSWQSAMIQFGLLRQAGLHPNFRPRIASLLEQLEKAEERVGELANSELWGVTLTPQGVRARAYGVGGDQTESNAMQLWSTVYPALRYARRSF